MSGPLDGLVVVDLSRAARCHDVGDLGARVIKVESHVSDDTRTWGPPLMSVPECERESTYFLAANRNKESICLDVKEGRDKEVLCRMIEKADVLIENFRPDVIARLGFGSTVMAAGNARLISPSLSGFGHDGPDAGRAGYDQIAQGEAGRRSLSGSSPDDPQRVGVPVSDLRAGMYGAYGVVAAVGERNRTGSGQAVRTSLLGAVVSSRAFRTPPFPPS
ncbi:CaiB/BaiF CoA transferase family protein [Jatrophihabitans sp. DSM 45814]